MIPYPNVTTTDSGNPIPPNCGMKSRIVRPQDSSIKVGVELVFLLHCTRMLGLDNLYSQHVFALSEQVRNLCFTAYECPFYAIDALSIQIDVGFPVNAIKIKKYSLPYHLFRQEECSAIPKVGIEERFRCHKQLVVLIGMRYSSYIDIA